MIVSSEAVGQLIRAGRVARGQRVTIGSLTYAIFGRARVTPTATYLAACNRRCTQMHANRRCVNARGAMTRHRMVPVKPMPYFVSANSKVTQYFVLFNSSE